MTILNILQHSDGATAWDNILIVALAFIAGWLLHQFTFKKKTDEKHRQAIAELEAKCKKSESEYKNYRSNIAAADKHQEKAALEANARVKALEGDIRALAEEKNKVHHQLTEKDQEIRRLLRQVSEKDDLISTIKETKARAEEEWTEKLRTSSQSLTRALAWEEKARHAEAEATRAKEAIGNAERKKLEAELRLKAVSDYAGKIGPLEKALADKDQLITRLQEQIRSVNDLPAATNDLPPKTIGLPGKAADPGNNDLPPKTTGLPARNAADPGNNDPGPRPTPISAGPEPLKSDL
jgi:chromosome segregation ATPase